MGRHLVPLVAAWSSTIGTGPAKARSVSELIALAKATTCIYGNDDGSYDGGYELVPVYSDLTVAMRAISYNLDHKRISAYLARHRGASVGRYRLCGTRIGKEGWYWVERKEAAGEAAMPSKPYGVAGPALDR